jgi:virginiamycin B lyase
MKIKTLLIYLGVCLLWQPMKSYADTVDIREWLVPWAKSQPGSPYVDSGGRVWFVGELDHYIANLSPETGEFNRYDLEKRSGPHSLIVDNNRNIWYTAAQGRHIGMLNPGTGRVAKIEMPDKGAKDPHTLVFDSAGDIWFTVKKGNFVGTLLTESREVILLPLPTKKSRPEGIVVNSRDEPWAVQSGNNSLLRVDRATMSIEEISLPREDSRPRRLVTTSDNAVWYADFALGNLGRYDPQSGGFTEWPMPGGADSKPLAMAVDRNDRIWIVETGVSPSRFVGFDTASGTFLTETDIPSGAGTVRYLYYYEPTGEIWFGTDSNYIGRAKVH